MLSTLDALVYSACCPPFAKIREEGGTPGFSRVNRKSFREAADAESDREANYDHVNS